MGLIRNRKRSEEVTAIPINELVDLRVEGMSFDQIAKKYQITKIIIYGYYREAERGGFGGYDPVGKEQVSRLCRSAEYTMPEIARILNMSLPGLKNYINDYHIEAGRKPNKRAVQRMMSIGKTEAWIAQFYGLSQQAIGRWCEKNGIEIPRNNNWKKQQDLYLQNKD